MRLSNLLRMCLGALFLLAIMSSRSLWAPEGTSASRNDGGTKWLSMRNGEPGVKPAINLLRSDNDGCSFEVKLNGVYLRQVKSDRNEFTRVFLPGYTSSAEVGQPDLPAITVKLATPTCAGVKTQFIPLEEITLDRVDVAPVPRMSHPDGEHREDYIVDERAYGNDEFSPMSGVSSKSTSKIRGQDVAELTIYPFSYNPLKHSLKVVTRFRVETTNEAPAGPVCRDVGPFTVVCKEVLLNYDLIGGDATSPALTSGPGSWANYPDLTSALEGNVDYLIVAADQLEADSVAKNWIEALAEKRSSYNRFNVAIVPYSGCKNGGGSEDEQLKRGLVIFYANNSAGHMGDGKLGYILLVGDDKDPEGNTFIPAHLESPCTLYGCTANDHYYSILQPGGDELPDVSIGRLSVDDAGEMEAVAEKIVNYEPHDASSGWIDQILIATGSLSSPLNTQFDSAEDVHEWENRQGNKFAGIYNFQTINRFEMGGDVHLGDPEWHPNENVSAEFGDSIAAIMNSGVVYYSMLSHGVPFYTAASFYQTNYEDSNKLYNDGKYPLVFDAACETGMFQFQNNEHNPFCSSPGNGCSDNSYTGISCYSPAAPNEVDPCDCMSERLMNIAHRGAIGVFGCTFTVSTEIQFILEDFNTLLSDYYYEPVGDLATMLYMLHLTSGGRALNYLGDPALNIYWREETSTDRVDLAMVRAQYDAVLRNNSSVSCKVRNAGVNNAYNFSVAVKIDGETAGSTNVDSLEAYHDTSVSVPLTSVYAETGLIDLSFVVNPDHSINEFTYNNNTLDTLGYVIDNTYQPGYPVKLRGKCASEITVANVDNNADKELVLGLTSKEIAAFSGGGTEIGSIDLASGTQFPDHRANVLVGRVTSDEKEEVYVAACSSSVIIYVIDIAMEDIVCSQSFEGNYSIKAVVSTLYDLDRDGRDEVVVAVDFLSTPGFLQVFDYEDGEFIADIGKRVNFVDYDRPLSLAVDDRDFDNSPEIVLLAMGYYSPTPPAFSMWIEIIDYDMWESDRRSYALSIPTGLNGVTMGGEAVGRVQYYDVNKDFYPDIVASAPTRLVVLNGKTLDKMWDDQFGYERVCDPLVGDFDADGCVELCLQDSVDRYTEWERDGGTFAVEHSLQFGSTINVEHPLAADIDADGLVEIVLPYRCSQLGQHMYNFIALDSDLNVISECDTITVPGSQSSVHSALVNFGDDGCAELAFTLDVDSTLHVVDFPSQNGGELVWPMVLGNEKETNSNMRYVKGTFTDNLSLWNKNTVVGDVTANAGLFIQPGTAVLVNTTDADTTGADTTRCEITLNGSCDVQGEANDPIQFRSSATTPGQQDWVGIKCADEEETYGFGYVQIDNAVLALESHGDLDLSHCAISPTNYCGIDAGPHTTIESSTIYLLGDLVVNGGETLVITGNTDIEVSPTDHRNLLSDPAIVEVKINGELRVIGSESDHVRIRSFSEEPSGFDWDGIEVTDSASTYVKFCELSNGYRGIWTSGANADSIIQSDITNCGNAGVYISGVSGSNPTFVRECNLNSNGSGAVIDHCDNALVDSCNCNGNTNGVYLLYSCSTVKRSTMQANSYGIYSDATSGDAPLISWCRPKENSQAGIYFKNTAGKIERCTLYNNQQEGLKCEGAYTTVEVKYTAIAGNYVGVKTSSIANPVLGNTSTQKGMHNSIYWNTTFNVDNNSYGTLKAENCWWGNGPGQKPDTGKFDGSVDFNPYLEQSPLDPMEESSPVIEARYSLGFNAPNPFNPTTTIRYSVADNADVNLSIYNVNGQLIRTLVDEVKPQGAYEVTWDGKDDRGVSVSSGVYFYRLVTKDFTQTKKMILLK